MTYILSTIGDRTSVITRDQYEKISLMIEAGQPDTTAYSAFRSNLLYAFPFRTRR